MVVMEYLSEKEYCIRSTIEVDAPSSVEVNTVKSNIVKFDIAKFETAIKHAVKLLHDHDYVHGDIRACNIMVRRQWDDSIGMKNVKLFDFDWAGKVETTRYPANVNYVLISRPEDARDGLPIKKEHDHDMLTRAVHTIETPISPTLYVITTASKPE